MRHDLANFKQRLQALEEKVAREGIILTESQARALERKKLDDEACGEIETAHLNTAADLLNDRVLPFYEAEKLPILRILTDRGTEYCGRADQHDYQLYIAVNEIEHTKTKARHPQTNGICERFHKTILQEFHQVALRKKLCTYLKELQQNLDEWLIHYNTQRTHQGKQCCGRTLMETLIDGKEIWKEKFVARI